MIVSDIFSNELQTFNPDIGAYFFLALPLESIQKCFFARFHTASRKNVPKTFVVDVLSNENLVASLDQSLGRISRFHNGCLKRT